MQRVLSGNVHVGFTAIAAPSVTAAAAVMSGVTDQESVSGTWNTVFDASTIATIIVATALVALVRGLRRRSLVMDREATPAYMAVVFLLCACVLRVHNRFAEAPSPTEQFYHDVFLDASAAFLIACAASAFTRAPPTAKTANGSRRRVSNRER